MKYTKHLLLALLSIVSSHTVFAGLVINCGNHIPRLTPPSAQTFTFQVDPNAPSKTYPFKVSYFEFNIGNQWLNMASQPGEDCRISGGTAHEKEMILTCGNQGSFRLREVHIMRDTQADPHYHLQFLGMNNQWATWEQMGLKATTACSLDTNFQW